MQAPDNEVSGCKKPDLGDVYANFKSAVCGMPSGFVGRKVMGLRALGGLTSGRGRGRRGGSCWRIAHSHSGKPGQYIVDE
jgi:hypothetical protein